MKLLALLLGFAAVASCALATTQLRLPVGRPLRVAVVITDHATMIDFAGPWEVFQDVQAPGGNGPAFELYTVSDDTRPLRISAGMRVVPDFRFADAPPPDVVVVGAQAGRSPEMLAWLKAQAARADVLMSVCTGASKLAMAGLLDGKEAATHHEFVETLGQRYPRVKFVRGQRFVQSDATIITAGGLTSGIDAALHVVERYFGREVAQRTAEYMEHDSDGWKSGTR